MNKDIIDRLLEKYGNDRDILVLLSEKSALHRKVQILETKAASYKGQLEGLNKFIAAKKLLEGLEDV